MMARGFLAIGLLLSSLGGEGRGSDDVKGPDEVVSVLRRFCLDCHGASKPKGGVDLSRKHDGEAEAADVGAWERVIDQVEVQSMPPEGRPRPSAVEADRLVRWASSRLSEARSKVATGPGRVTLRRLNRSEDNNTIRDLVGVNLRPTDEFPSDGLAKHYGIDDVLGFAFRKVALDNGRRGGMLTQASVLTVTSNPARTSPVKRRKWVLEQLLGTPPPPSLDASSTLPSGRTFRGPDGLKVYLMERREDFTRCVLKKPT